MDFFRLPSLSEYQLKVLLDAAVCISNKWARMSFQTGSFLMRHHHPLVHILRLFGNLGSIVLLVGFSLAPSSSYHQFDVCFTCIVWYKSKNACPFEWGASWSLFFDNITIYWCVQAVLINLTCGWHALSGMRLPNGELHGHSSLMTLPPTDAYKQFLSICQVWLANLQFYPRNLQWWVVLSWYLDWLQGSFSLDPFHPIRALPYLRLLRIGALSGTCKCTLCVCDSTGFEPICHHVCLTSTISMCVTPHFLHRH